MSNIDQGNVISQLSKKEELNQLNEIVDKVTAQLKAERRSGKPMREQIVDTVSKTTSEADQLENKIENLKSEAKKRKREIDEWKQWYNALAATDKSAEMAKLKVEIAWRAKDIKAAEKKIQSLLKKHLKVKGQAENAKQQLAAFDAGAYDGPIEADPRLVAAKRARDEVKKRLSGGV